MDKSGISKMGKWKQVQQYAKHVPFPLRNYQKNKDRASGILLLDATFTKIKGKDRAIMIAYDTGIGVIDYWIDVTENATGYSLIFQHLDKVGYRPICVVSDGHRSLLRVIKERNLPHQRCIFHLLRELKRRLGKGLYPELTGRKKVLYSRIKYILKTKRIEDLPERIRVFRKKTEHLFTKEQLVLDWFHSVLPHAVLHLSYEENIPNGTNLLENLNGQIKQRIKTMRGMKSEKSLDNLLKILFYFNDYKF